MRERPWPRTFQSASQISMTDETNKTLLLAQALIRRASVSPEDGGCQALIAERLSAVGFGVESLVFGDVTNLWARRGNLGPLLVFL